MENKKPAPEAEEKAMDEQEAKRKKKRRFFSNIMMAVSAVCFAIGIYLLLKEFVIPPATDYVAPPAPTQTPLPTPAPTPDAAAARTPEPTQTPEPTPYSLLPVEILFPTLEQPGKLGQACEVVPVGKINPETKEEVSPMEPGAMGTVDSHIIAGWYKYNPSPGDYGNAIINGHKSYKGEKGVFDQLKDLKLGDQVVVKMDDGSYLYWYVDTLNIYPRDEVPLHVMEPRWGSDPELTLITCTGRWDALAGTSSKRVVATLRMYETDMKAFEAEQAAAE